MAIIVNPPPSIKIPREWQKNPEIVAYYKNFDRMMLQLWERTGGSRDAVSDAQNRAQSAFNANLQQLTKEIKGLPEFTMDTTGFTMDSTEFTMDKVIA